MRDRDAQRGSWRSLALVAASLVVIAAWSWFARASGGTEPAPAVTSGAVVQVDSEAAAPIAVAPLAPVRTAADPATAVIRGVVRDRNGVVIPGWPVSLGAPNPGPESFTHLAATIERQAATTGADGTFEFGGLLAGIWFVDAERRTMGERVVLAAGEERLLELVVDESGAVVTLRVTSQGVAAPGRDLHVAVDGERDRRAHTGASGVVTMLLPAGMHRVEVRGSVGGLPRRREWKCQRFVEVPFGVRSLRCDVEVPTTNVELVLADASPPRELVFTIAGTADEDPEPFRIEKPANDGRAATALPPGRWTVGLRAIGIVESAPHEVVTGAGVPRVRVDVTTVPAACVMLDLRRPDGCAFALPSCSPAVQDLLPRLVCGERRFAPGPFGDNAGLLAGSAPLAFTNVPLGAAVLIARDRTEDGALVHLPFDPIDDRAVEVLPGTNRAAVVVQARAFVELTACTKNGMQDVRARIRVFADGTLVKPACSAEQARWQAFLPPGDYRIVVQRPDATTESRLVVHREPITLRLRAP